MVLVIRDNGLLIMPNMKAYDAFCANEGRRAAWRRLSHDFFSKMKQPFRPVPIRERIGRGDALVEKAKALLQEKGDAPEILNEAIGIYRAAVLNYEKAHAKARRQLDAVKLEIGAKRAECHLEIGILYGKLGNEKKAGEHYCAIREIACGIIISKEDTYGQRLVEALENSYDVDVLEAMASRLISEARNLTNRQGDYGAGRGKYAEAATRLSVAMRKSREPAGQTYELLAEAHLGIAICKIAQGEDGTEEIASAMLYVDSALSRGGFSQGARQIRDRALEILKQNMTHPHA